MRNVMKSLWILIGIIIVQLLLYHVFLKPVITTWGASKSDMTLPMAGDNKTLTITSTRAIVINAPKAEVWQWLMQLGADRSGFYSYTFIEEALGYDTRPQDTSKPDVKDFVVGDLIRGSIHPEQSITPYNFTVLAVNPKNSLVLNNWGTLLLTEVNPNQTRLMMRTQVPDPQNAWQKTANYIEIPLHFIMERRTLLGIKARAESPADASLSQNADKLWFSAIVLAGILITLFVFIGRGLILSIVVPFIFSSLWITSLLLLDPLCFYSMTLALMLVIALLLLGKKKHAQRYRDR